LNFGTMAVSNSTISGNNAFGGGGIGNIGTLTISGSTVSGNSTNGLGGGGINNEGTLTVSGSTISGNSASVGGGIFNLGELTLSNSIVAGNAIAGNSTFDKIIYGGYYADLYPGSYTDNGGNQASRNTGLTSTIAINLAPLGSYGGPTQTMVPLPGSPAICAGLASNISAGVTTDQRGYPNTNTAYAGYSPGTPCVDSGTVQTNYSLSFTGEPSPISPATSILTNTHFHAAVTLEENGRAFNGGSASVPLTLAGTGTLSNGTASTSGGVATYSTLQVNAADAGDVLAAHLTLTASGAAKPATISASSSPFNVDALATPTITFAAAPTPTYPGASFTVSATTSSNGALSYSYVSGPCSQVSGSIFRPTGVGTCVVQATTAATATFLAGSSEEHFPITSHFGYLHSLDARHSMAATFADLSIPLAAAFGTSGFTEDGV
jgi:hypothetical protein